MTTAMTHPTLTDDEARVLGTLIEKAQTTPAQYPLTLNALVTGCNQKNNREPLTTLTEDRALDAIDGLRRKELVREALLSGSRVTKYRHVARERLGLSTAELVLIAELLLRGPQPLGSLRGNAARMMPPGDESLATAEAARVVIEGLMHRPEPMAELWPPVSGSGVRAPRYAQLLSPGLHPRESAEYAPVHASAGAPLSPMHDAELSGRVDALEKELAAVKAAVRRLAASLGEPFEP